MTTVYWAAAAVALFSAAEAAVELARDRSAVLAAWMLSMMAMSASLAVAAAVPAVLGNGPEPAASACSALGIVGTWTFAEVLAARASEARRLADIVRTPLLGGACALSLLLGLRWAASHGTGDQSSELTTIVIELTVMAYYVPALCRIAFFAHQRAKPIPSYWTRMVMRMVATSAAVELVLVMARSAVLVARASGLEVSQSAIAVISVLQGLAVICGVGGLVAGPVMMAISVRCGSWLTGG